MPVTAVNAKTASPCQECSHLGSDAGEQPAAGGRPHAEGGEWRLTHLHCSAEAGKAGDGGPAAEREALGYGIKA